MSYKGDLKYLVQSLNLVRHAGKEEAHDWVICEMFRLLIFRSYTEALDIEVGWGLQSLDQVCYRCSATKGNGDFSLVYTDISETAAWRSQPMPGPMFDIPPAVASLKGFSDRLVSLDHLGVLRDLVGTGFKLFALKRGEYYNGRRIPIRLNQLTRDLKEYCRAYNLQCSLAKVHEKTLLWRSDCCPELRCKGADALVCLKFMVHKLQQKPHNKYPLLLACAWCALQFIGCLSSASIFLLEEERATAQETGYLFLRTYLSLAVSSLAANQLLFKTRPKLHFLVHILDDLDPEPAGACRNPFYDSTFVDEDWVKHALQMKKKMSRRTSSLNVLRRFAVVNKAALDSLNLKPRLDARQLGRSSGG